MTLSTVSELAEASDLLRRVVAPAATPRPVIARLEEAVAWAMREPDLERIYVAQGQTPRFADAAAFRDRIFRGHETWGRVAREANITVD